MKYAVSLMVALVLNAMANLCMKIGMKSISESGGLLKDGFLAAGRTVLGSTTLVAGLGCFVLNAVFYMFALQSRSLSISIAYPVMVGGGYAIIATVAHYHPSLQESLTLCQKLGVGLILVGVLLIANPTTLRTESPA